MLTARVQAELDRAVSTLRKDGRHVALVPTMGALHAGHDSLVRLAQAECAAVICSIFVNPLQFGPNEDFSRYPRAESADLVRLEALGCDAAWVPDLGEMYPPGHATRITPAGPALGWEGERRAGHFAGVATVVARLFGQARPDIAVFGEKDWQQLQVVRRMVADLRLPVRVLAAPTARAEDGLALSSRNAYLTEAERAVAPELFAVLRACAARLRAGGPVRAALDAAHGRLADRGLVPEYVALVDGESLAALDAPAPASRLIAAARLGRVRLLDNVSLRD